MVTDPLSTALIGAVVVLIAFAAGIIIGVWILQTPVIHLNPNITYSDNQEDAATTCRPECTTTGHDPTCRWHPRNNPLPDAPRNS